MKYAFGPHEFEAEGPYLTLQLCESNSLLQDVEGLRDRMKRDGYLFFRGLQDREEVLQLRRDILQRMAERGELDPNFPVEDGVIGSGCKRPSTSSVRGQEHLKTERLRQLVYGPRILGFFERFLGGPVLSFNFQWLRVTGAGAGSTIHYDIVYMGRGTQNLYTCWTPIGDIPPEMGPIVLCEGSNRWEKVLATYGKTDVDRDHTEGYFSKDPAELVDKFGGRWATTSFRAGDVLILSMHIMHASLTNSTNRFRISCDTRYQLASEPADDRWIGPQPTGHTDFWSPDVKLEPVEVSRKRWGV